MIRKTQYFEQIDKYLDAELHQPELSEFEIQLETDSDLANELNLHLEVEQSFGEHDIVSLRQNLAQIVQNHPDTDEICVFDSFNFGLSEELSSHQNLNHLLSSEEILNFTHSFPKIHLYQHKIAGKENLHQFYKEQFNADAQYNEETFSQYEEDLFTDVQKALDESDIHDIRANLKQIASNMPAHQYSAEQIDDYVSNLMDPESRIQFEEELAVNKSLAHDVRLIGEIDLAVTENDIMNLRASLKNIQKSEFQSSGRIEEIENYIYNTLSEEEMASFEAELSSNSKLFEEVDLIKNIDLALNESDVMKLRSNLQAIAGEIASEKQTERSFIGRFKTRKIVFSAVAATLILLLGISGLLSRQSSQSELYHKFYSKYTTSVVARSSSSTTDHTLAIALQKFDNQEYETSRSLLQEVISRDQNNMVGHFYAGASLQELGKYQDAIKEYETVIVDKDNLFIEQAEWYIGMCYLQTNENKKAYKQFKKIADNQGFYQPKAQAILQKLKPNS